MKADHQNTHSVLTSFKRHPRSKLWKDLVASPNIWSRLDRVAVLGGEVNVPESHSGCVNALHWSADGSVLVSAGDDTRIHIWRLNPSEVSDNYSLRCTAKIHTGHTNNIFNAHILNGSSRIATCAADGQVRVFDVNRGGLTHHSGELTEYQGQQACVNILKCHSGRVKRIVTENSPDYFLTVAEDGTVRQHDLRTRHKCSRKNNTCPAPLLHLPLRLSTIALSPLTPYNFVVAGESPYGYLFDRRQTGRRLREEWGVDFRSNDLTSCVRRFGRRSAAKDYLTGPDEHITGSRMSQENGHELLLSYSGDAVYLYSTRDPIEGPSNSSSMLPLNQQRRPNSSNNSQEASGNSADHSTDDGATSDEFDVSMDVSYDSDREEPKTDDEEDEDLHVPEDLRLPIVYPRRRYVGACNVETVKDVNFVGPRDEYVVSGSDDGNFFIWDKITGDILDIHEGDGTVVNVIEQHPSLPVLSVSGIDDTVKIFAPVSGTRHSSRMSLSDEIVKANTTQIPPHLPRRFQISSLLWHYRRALSVVGDPPEDAECVYQ